MKFYKTLSFLHIRRKRLVKSKVKHVLPTDVVSELFKTDNGKRFLFEGREYLREIYNVPHRYIVIQASRQAEKSSYLAKDMLLSAIVSEHDSLLYVTALRKQRDEFVNRKINKQFNMSETLRRFFLGRESRDNNQEKILSNGTSMSFRAVGTDPDSARGLPVRKIYIDELQSINPESLAVVMECAQSYPNNSAYLISGTPLSSRNILSKKYTETCQNEWLITCSHCNKENPPLGIEHVDLEKPYLFCKYCGKDMQAMNGRWVAQRPASKKIGYRICRLMTPTCTWRTEAHDGILDKFEIYSEPQFYNEVLGLPFDQGVMPISEAEIYANCSEEDFVDANNVPDHIKQNLTFGAIDWAWSNREGGQAYTIYAIGRLNVNRIEVLYVKRFFGPQYHNPETVLKEIAHVSNAFGVDGIATDYGVGHKENLRLIGLVSARVFEMQYVSSDKECIWDKPSQSYRIGRTVTLDNVFNRLKKQLYKFPKISLMKTYADDIMNVFTEYDPNYKKIRYVHSETGPDDFLHLLNYLAIVIEIKYSKRIR